MSFSIQTNVNSLIAQENLRTNSNFQSQTIQRLTSGYRINGSGDDAAGLAIANKFRSDTAELTQGVRNANDGISTLQIIDGGMSNISKMLDRLRTLATQSASEAFTGNRTVVNTEFQNLLTEIDRQAQSIGLDTNGQFAKSLSVFVGGGKAAGTGAVETANGTVTVDLAASAVDTRSLGLKGLQAVGGTADIGDTSSTSTVAQIKADGANTTSVSGFSEFLFAGPGFSDGSKVNVSVNLSGVTNLNTLVTAVNTAIQTAGSGTSQAATAFKDAGIAASVVTDADGQHLAFTSSSTAFQVQAGDRMANAFLGNLTGTTGAALAATVRGGNTAADGPGSFSPTNVTLRITGAGMTAPKGHYVLQRHQHGLRRHRRVDQLRQRRCRSDGGGHHRERLRHRSADLLQLSRREVLGAGHRRQSQRPRFRLLRNQQRGRLELRRRLRVHQGGGGL